ncbi:MAG TPA: alpha/beta hydrolase [Jiangellaceae bacterium]|nr:alpha/beta hydrolase [Jiangellaceae bacterium]
MTRVRAAVVAVPLLLASCASSGTGDPPASTLPTATGQTAAGATAPELTGAQPCGEPGFTCSTLVVPLDHSGGVPGELPLAVLTADNVDAPRGVLLFLTGGPGQPGVPSAARVRASLESALDEYRLVMLDQRGTGANALQCPVLQEQVGTTDFDVPTADAVRDCGDAIGADRRFYSTSDTVADLEMLRMALGVESWTLDGVSYGSYVAERYLIARPDRVARAVLDSVVPHRLDLLDPMLFSAYGRVLREACEATGCVTDPAEDLAAVVRETDLGPDLLSAIGIFGIVDPDYGGLPELLHAAAGGEAGPLEGFLEDFRADTRVPAADLSQGLHASTLCAEAVWPWESDSAPAGRTAALDAFVASLPEQALWPFDRATLRDNGLAVTCLNWPATPEPLPEPPDDKDLPDVPVLMVVGDRDLSTPVELARQEEARAPRVELVVIPDAGHSVQTRGPDVAREAVIAFLGDG